MQPRSHTLRLPNFGLLLPALLCLAGTDLFAQRQLRLSVLDFKTHGQAVVLQTPGGRTWLVDVALRPTGDYYPARDVIAPFLQNAGVRAIDGIVISHPHGDHCGGLPYLVEHFRVGQLVDAGYDEIGGVELETYRRHRADYVARGGKSVIVKLGARLDLDPALEAEILWPPAGLHRPDPKRTDEALYNSNSIVLRIRHGANTILIPGDHHGLSGLARFVGAEKLKCDLLVAPHHGLNSSSAMAEATRPQYVAVASLREYLNPLIRPLELTTSAFGPVGATVYATWAHGHIIAVSDGSALQVTTARQP